MYQGSARTQGLDARPGAELSQSSVQQGPWLYSSSFCSSYPHCLAHPSVLAHSDHCTACFSLVQSHDSFPLTLLALCLEVTFFVFKLGVEGLAPWLPKCFFPAWQKPLGIVVVEGREVFPFSTCRRETEA